MKDKLTMHANERFFDRTDQEVTRKMIVNHINNGGQIDFAMRMTASRSLAYIPIRDEVFKVIINRKSKKIVSILPFKDIYAINILMYSEYYDNKYYIIHLFPDCFQESNGKKQALTKIHELDNNRQVVGTIAYNHPFFDGLFDAAMNFYLGTKRIINNETIKVKAKAQTIVIKKPEIIGSIYNECRITGGASIS